MDKKISIIIPAYNEEKSIKDLLLQIPKDIQDEVIVVDDGSTDNTYKESKFNGAKVIRNKINYGYGASTLRGIYHSTGDIIVTIDADCQNNPKEIKDLIKPILDGKVDCTIGSRYLGKMEKPTPFYKRIGEIFVGLVIKLCYGKKVTYSQSGFRAFKKTVFKQITPFKERRYGFTMELLVKLLKNKVNYKEIPITFYERKTGKSHVNVIKDGLRILWTLFKTMAFVRKSKIYYKNIRKKLENKKRNEI